MYFSPVFSQIYHWTDISVGKEVSSLPPLHEAAPLPAISSVQHATSEQMQVSTSATDNYDYVYQKFYFGASNNKKNLSKFIQLEF